MEMEFIPNENLVSVFDKLSDDMAERVSKVIERGHEKTAQALHAINMGYLLTLSYAMSGSRQPLSEALFEMEIINIIMGLGRNEETE